MVLVQGVDRGIERGNQSPQHYSVKVILDNLHLETGGVEMLRKAIAPSWHRDFNGI